MSELARKIDLAFIHARIHRDGEGCCCPGHGVFCPLCPTHKEQHADRLAEAERLLRRFLREPVAAERDGCVCQICSVSRNTRTFLESQP